MRKTILATAILTAFLSGAAAAGTRYTTSSTIGYHGTTYTYSSTSTCAGGTAALRLNRKWWCPVISSTTTASTSSGTTSTTSTSTSGTTTISGTTTSTGTSGATTSTGSTTTSTSATTSPSSTTTTTAPVSYSASVSWAIPTTRADGTLLSASELSGYEVYYTNDTGSVNAVVPVSGGSIANTQISNLASGNYYFSISAIDASGLKSTLSTMASLSIP